MGILKNLRMGDVQANRRLHSMVFPSKYDDDGHHPRGHTSPSPNVHSPIPPLEPSVGGLLFDYSLNPPMLGMYPLHTHQYAVHPDSIGGSLWHVGEPDQGLVLHDRALVLEVPWVPITPTCQPIHLSGTCSVRGPHLWRRGDREREGRGGREKVTGMGGGS